MQNNVSSPRDNVESRICIFDKKSPETVSMASVWAGYQVIETPGPAPAVRVAPALSRLPVLALVYSFG